MQWFFCCCCCFIFSLCVRQIDKMKKDNEFHKFSQVVNKLQLLFYLLSLYQSQQYMPYLWNADIKLIPPSPNLCNYRRMVEKFPFTRQRQNTINVLSQDFAYFLALFHDLISKNLDYLAISQNTSMDYYIDSRMPVKSNKQIPLCLTEVGKKLLKYSKFCFACGILGNGGNRWLVAFWYKTTRMEEKLLYLIILDIIKKAYSSKGSLWILKANVSHRPIFQVHYKALAIDGNLLQL